EQVFHVATHGGFHLLVGEIVGGVVLVSAKKTGEEPMALGGAAGKNAIAENHAEHTNARTFPPAEARVEKSESIEVVVQVRLSHGAVTNREPRVPNGAQDRCELWRVLFEKIGGLPRGHRQHAMSGGEMGAAVGKVNRDAALSK